MVRVSIAAALVFCLASAAVAEGNGARKITGFTDQTGDDAIDGVGVINHSNGGDDVTTLHVVLTGLPEGEYFVEGWVEICDVPVPLFQMAEPFTPNNGGVANIKLTALGDHVDGLVLIEVRDGGGTLFADWKPLGD